jgi:hypothetical protein
MPGVCTGGLMRALLRTAPHTPCLGLPQEPQLFLLVGPWEAQAGCMRGLACCRYRRKGKNTLWQFLEVCCCCNSTSCPTHMTCLGLLGAARPDRRLACERHTDWLCVGFACYGCCCSKCHLYGTTPRLPTPAVVWREHVVDLDDQEPHATGVFTGGLLGAVHRRLPLTHPACTCLTTSITLCWWGPGRRRQAV